jgi:hypothetical protein
MQQGGEVLAITNQIVKDILTGIISKAKNTYVDAFAKSGGPRYITSAYWLYVTNE